MAKYTLPSLVLLLATALPAQAQISADGGPIRLNADRSSVFEREQRVNVVGNVDIVQGTARLRADRVTLFYSPGTGAAGGTGSGFGAIEQIVAAGEVFYITPELKARGDRGTYAAETDTITLEDNVVLIRCEDVARGDKLIIRVTEGRTTLEGGEEGRVQMLIVPGSEDGANDCDVPVSSPDPEDSAPAGDSATE